MTDIAFNFDIDRYLNRFIPRSRLYLLPKPISWFLGHRESRTKPIGTVVVWFWSFIGAFCGILVIEAVFQSDRLKSDGAPIVIASMGAAAILEYNTIDSPFAQPRNAFLGQIFSALIGVSITKLFKLNPDFENLRWVAGALSVGLASVAMGFTKTVHPPAGATALLASTSPDIEKLGWFLVPLIILGTTLMLAVALVINNIQRQFPVYWWTPVDLNRPSKRDVEAQDAEEKGEQSSGQRTSYDDYVIGEEARIVIDDERIVIPNWISLDSEETSMLEVLRQKLKEGLRSTSSNNTDETHVHNTS